MLNNISIMGRLTKDVDLRYTGNQTAVASFSIAVERDFSGSTKERVTDFIDIVAWRSTAEFAEKYFHKGDMIVVSGRLQIRNWEKDGTKHRSAEILADHLYFSGSNAKKTETQEEYTEPEFEEEDSDEGLPF